MDFVIKNSLDKDKVFLYINRLLDRPLGYKIEILPIRKKRSLNQNDYYWGVIIKMLSDELGYFPEEMHDALRIKFLLSRKEKLTTIKSTTRLSTVDFETYMSDIRTWAANEMEIIIPLPNEII